MQLPPQRRRSSRSGWDPITLIWCCAIWIIVIGSLNSVVEWRSHASHDFSKRALNEVTMPVRSSSERAHSQFVTTEDRPHPRKPHHQKSPKSHHWRSSKKQRREPSDDESSNFLPSELMGIFPALEDALEEERAILEHRAQMLQLESILFMDEEKDEKAFEKKWKAMKEEGFRHLPPLDPRNVSSWGGKTGEKTYLPGRVWLDMEGKPIQAHGGGIMFAPEKGKYYWYGEIKQGKTVKTTGLARVDIVGVGCYSSSDLWSWHNEGIALAAEPHGPNPDLHPSLVLERPKVIYNERTRTYVMWMHIDSADYQTAAVGVAISSTPEGPFNYLGSKRPHDSESRDMTLFKDSEGQAFLIYSSEDNAVMHVGQLTPDYLDLQGPMSRILAGLSREAPAVFHFRDLYFLVTSGCSGWAPNAAAVHIARSMMGPWRLLGNPCSGGPTPDFADFTFLSQGTFVQPLPNSPNKYIFMADRWNEDDLQDSRYVWLPLTVEVEDTPGMSTKAGHIGNVKVDIHWHDRWILEETSMAVA